MLPDRDIPPLPDDSLPMEEQLRLLRQHLTELSQRETHFRTLFNRLPVGIYESSLDGQLLNANPYLAQLLGFDSLSDLMQHSLQDIYHNYDAVMPQIMLTLQRTEHIDNLDLRLVRRDGSVLWTSVNLAIIRDIHGRLCIQGIVWDVTPRKLSERALRESEERYQSVVMALVEGVIVCNADDIIIACNPSAEQILGQPSVQLIGKRPLQHLETRREDGSDIPYEDYPSLQALRTGRPCLNQRMKVVRLDGSTVWIAINSQPLFYPGEDTPYGVVSSFQDITQRVVTRAQLERQMQVLRVINAISAAGAESKNEQEFLLQTEAWMREIFRQVKLDLLVLNESQGMLENVTHEHQVHLGNGLSGIVAIDGRTRIIDDLGPEAEPYAPLHPGTQSALCTPITAEEQILGVLCLESAHRGAFDENTEEMARALCGQIASVLVKMRSLEEERQRLKQLETLVNISRAMRRAQNTTEILSILVERTIDVLGASSLALLLDRGQVLQEAWLYNLDPGLTGTAIPERFNDPYWQVMQNRQMAFLPTEHMPPEPEQNPVLRAVLSHSYWSVLMPLKATHTMLGVMHIAFTDHRNKLTRTERETLTTMAEIAGISLHRTQITETLEQRVAERTRSLQALYNLRQVAGELLELPEMLRRALTEVLNAVQTDAGAVYMAETNARGERRLVLHVSSGIPQPVIDSLHQLEYKNQIYWEDWILHDPLIIQVPDLTQRAQVPRAVLESNLRHFIALPMRFKNRMIGVLAIFSHRAEAFTTEDINLLENAANQVADAIETARLRRQAQEGAVVQERQRLARELHDSVTQALYSLNLMVNAARRFAESGNLERSLYYLDQLPDISQQALKEMRLLIYDLRPSALEEEGLAFALGQRLETVERRAGVNAALRCDPAIKLPREIEEGIYRITIEALNNVLKHAAATDAAVRVEANEDTVVLEVEDNGKGFEPTHGILSEGIGMKSMRERAEQLRGSFEIFSRPGSGALVRAVIPLKPASATGNLVPENFNPGDINY
ncbi:MAG: GAF domain-containing protein [Anaerolineae bacterium]|nr:GAF domain-containing protein [Anaerolineae bacterium]